jgi:CSLREA domain-containing protein
VTTTDDELNNDGDCALREAIEAANTDTAVDACPAGSGDDIVVLPGGTYPLDIPGAGENNNQTGDLDILDSMTIQGAGADATVIDGGGLDRVLQIHPGRVVEISDVTVANGHLYDGYGGGIENESGVLTLNDAILRDNLVTSTAGGYFGGAGLDNDAYYQNATTTLNRCLVTGNTAFAGGAFSNAANAEFEATLTLNNTTVISNTAEYVGGGIWNDCYVGSADPASIVVLNGSTVSGNIVSGSGFYYGVGGGIFEVCGSAILVNSTVSGNQAIGSGLPDYSGLGGGIFFYGAGITTTLTLSNTTVAGNTASAGGGGIAITMYNSPTEARFKNSLIGDNSAPAGVGETCYNYDHGSGLGTLTSLGNNLEDYDYCEFDQPDDLPNTDPVLGPLANNGGDTQTHALLAGSPAIDAGDDATAPPTDQRGVPRPQGPHSDIGSYEANILVNTCDDELNSDGDCSLREAIEAANTDTAVDACMAGSGHDYITLPACTYTLAIAGVGEDNNQTGDLDILDDLTIYGAGAETTIVDANAIDRVLHILDGSVAEVNDLAIANGRVIDEHGGGIHNAGSTLTLNDAILRENVVISSGGSLAGGALGNSARFGPATATLNNSFVVGNTSFIGGGLANGAGPGFTATLTLSNTTVASNTAQLDSGGIHQSWFSGASDARSSTILHNSVVEDNTALNGDGGGIDTYGFPANNVIATLTVEHSTIRGNSATGTDPYTGRGGGICVQDSRATLLASTVSGNTASGDAFVSGHGGGLFILDSPVELVNSTVSGNQALGSGLPNVSGLGGGVLVAGQYATATLALTNTNVSGNSSNVGGGGVANVYFGSHAETRFKNSLIAGNSAPEGESCINPDVGYGLGTLTSLGHNLEDYDYCEFNQPSDWPSTDGLLGPLEDNGGPTWTHALLEGSLARDHGDDAACPATDQRGVARPQGPHCDIGAFEAYADENPPTILAVSPPDGAVDVALDASLVITFSEPISVPTFVYSLVPDPGGWSGSWGPNNVAVTLTHDPFEGRIPYTATVSAAEDRVGNPLAEPFEWAFTTVCEAVQIVTVTPEISGCLVTFGAELSGSPPFDYLWDLGAMGTYTGTNPVVDFGADGTYPYTLTVTNCGGSGSDTHSGEVEVTCPPAHRIYLPVVLRAYP